MSRCIVVGGGLAGLAVGCYAAMNGHEPLVVEHELALGGGCTAWRRGGYTVDGCVHWLVVGPFEKLYRELGIVPRIALRVVDEFSTYHHVRDGWSVTLTRDLDAFAADLARLAPQDRAAVRQLVVGARRLGDLAVEHERRLAGAGYELLASRAASILFRFQEPLGKWLRAHVASDKARAVLGSLLPARAPTALLLALLSYLERGELARPAGGSGALRDAVAERYAALGGRVELCCTVDEVLVERHRAAGVALSDGRELHADAVACTADSPASVRRLLSGRYGSDGRRRVDRASRYRPMFLASFGVRRPLCELPTTLVLAELEPFEVGGRRDDRLYLRIFNDAPELSPPGHTVVQAMMETSYEHWSSRGADYGAARVAAARLVAERIEAAVPGFVDSVDMVDVRTPLCSWRHARGWRGGLGAKLAWPWALGSHAARTLPGLSGFYLARQSPEPGGGVLAALLAGRQLADLLVSRERPLSASA